MLSSAISRATEFLYGPGMRAKKVLGAGVGFGLGVAASYKLMDKIKLSYSWKQISSSHISEMSGWEDEAKKIFGVIGQMAPSIASDPSTAWYLIKNIKMSGGISYPVSRKLLDLESGVGHGAPAIKPYFQPVGVHEVGGHFANYMSKHSSIPPYKMRDFLGSLKGILPIAGKGLAAGAIAPLAIEGFGGMKRNVDKSWAWDSFKTRNKIEIAGWEDEAKEYFFALMRYLPDMIEDDDTVLSFIKHMREQGGMDFSVMTDLLTTAKSLSKSRGMKPHAGYLGNLLSGSLSGVLSGGM